MKVVILVTFCLALAVSQSVLAVSDASSSTFLPDQEGASILVGRTDSGSGVDLLQNGAEWISSSMNSLSGGSTTI